MTIGMGAATRRRYLSTVNTEVWYLREPNVFTRSICETVGRKKHSAGAGAVGFSKRSPARETETDTHWLIEWEV